MDARSQQHARWLLTCCGGGVLLVGLAAGRIPDGAGRDAGRPLDRAAVSADAAPLARGRALYAKHCLACHGPSGQGDGSAGRDLDPQPSDLSQPEVTEKTDAQLFRQITRGRRPMPSFQKLPDDDRWQIVHYVRALAGTSPDDKHKGDRR